MYKRGDEFYYGSLKVLFHKISFWVLETIISQTSTDS